MTRHPEPVALGIHCLDRRHPIRGRALQVSHTSDDQRPGTRTAMSRGMTLAEIGIRNARVHRFLLAHDMDSDDRIVRVDEDGVTIVNRPARQVWVITSIRAAREFLGY